MANPQYRLDEEEKKIIDLIRQIKLDHDELVYFLKAGMEFEQKELKKLYEGFKEGLMGKVYEETLIRIDNILDILEE